MNNSAPVSPSLARSRLVGLLCVAALVAALLALGWWSRGGWQTRDEFTTFLPQPGGLAKGAPVTLLGLPAGRVRELRLVERGGRLGVEVSFWVARERREWLRAGTEVVAVSDLMGAARLELRPNLAARELVSAGAELPGALTPDVLTQMTELQPAVRKLIDEIGALAAAMTERAGQVDPILAGINRELESARVTQEQLRSVLTEARALFARTAADEQAMAASFARIVEGLSEDLLPRVGRSLEQSNERLGAVFDTLQRTSATVEQRLPRLLELSEETLKNSRDVSEAAAHTWPFNRYLKKRADATTPAAATRTLATPTEDGAKK